MDLQDFINEVLASEFPGESKKQEVITTQTGFNFACPFCGDSTSHAHKKRGNIYLNSKTFKCFNDGCMTWMPLKRFIGTLSDKYSIDITDLEIDFDAIDTVRTHRFVVPENNIMNFLHDTGAYATLLDMDYVRDRFSLINVNDLPSTSIVRQFLTDRLLFNIPNMSDYIYADYTDSLIYIFNYHKSTGKILSLATRKVEYKKYNVIPYSHICKNLHIDPCEDHADVIDQLGEYFNIMNVDLHRPVKTAEGQIDSMFMENSCAVQGVTKSMFLLDSISPEHVWTMFDRDKAGMGASLKEILNGHKAFMWTLLIERLKRKYSPNDIKLRKIKDTNDLYIYMYGKTALPLDRFNILIDSYFTSSKFDMLFL